MVKFNALQSAKVEEFKTPNRQSVGLNVGLSVGLDEKVILLITNDPSITMRDIAKELNVTQRTVERVIKLLREENRIERKGGKRFGYWEVH